MDSDLDYSESVSCKGVDPESKPDVGLPASAANGRRQLSSLERTLLNPGSVLFPTEDMDQFRARWLEIQAGFVDEPRRAVEQANALVGLVIQHLMDMFTNERAKLENLWGQGKDVSTEDLRQALRRYRSFFDRLLSV